MVFKLSATFVAFAAVATTANFKRVVCPSGHIASHDACCVFFPLADDLKTNLFGTVCGEDVHKVIHLTFHDAIGFSLSGKFRGTGADGSMIIFSNIETNFPENLGISDSVDNLKLFLTRHDVTAGDMIKFAGTVALSNCLGAPRIDFLAGHPNVTFPASNATVPLPEDPVTKILDRMADAGFTPAELIHLLASHTVARADHVDPTIHDVPFDSTPFTFNTQVFLEVLLKGTGVPGTPNNTGEALLPLPTEGELRLQSDDLLARDPRTACEWQSMVDNQQLMMSNFKSAMQKLAITGHNPAHLINCSKVVPPATPPVGKPTTFPAGLGPQDLKISCPLPFPSLATDSGAPTHIPACPDGSIDEDECADQVGSMHRRK